MNQPFTADTITDAQIRELRAALQREDWDDKIGPRTRARVAICNNALVKITSTMIPTAVDGVLRARARCAEILNARSGK